MHFFHLLLYLFVRKSSEEVYIRSNFDVENMKRIKANNKMVAGNQHPSAMIAMESSGD